MSPSITVDRGLALPLAECAAQAGSGIATVIRGKCKRLFCVERGRLVHAASNVIEEQLPETLAAWGILTQDVASAARQQAHASRRPFAEILVREGAIDADVLRQTLEDHARGLLFATLPWPDGECRFERGIPDLRCERKVDLCPVRLVLDYARDHPATLAEVQARIGPPAVRPRLRRDREVLLDRFEPSEAARALLANCDGSYTVDRLLEKSPAKEESWRTVYAMVLLGILELEQDPGARDVRPEGGATRAEVLARLERATGADPYAVLELNPACSQDEIREGYYFLARRYHPDRFRAGALRDLLPRIEEFFSQVTEAYNTLFDPEQRKAHDERRRTQTPTRPEAAQDTRYLARQNYLRARALIDKGQRAAAVKYLENAIQLDESRAAYHHELGRLLSGNPRRRQEAERHLVRANEIDPALAEGYLALGELYVKLGRRDEAIALFREVLRWEPGHIQATARLDELAAGDGGALRGLFRG